MHVGGLDKFYLNRAGFGLHDKEATRAGEYGRELFYHFYKSYMNASLSR